MTSKKFKVKMPSLILNIYKDRFKRYLILVLAIIGILLLIRGEASQELAPTGNLTIHFFYLPTCPHCIEQKSLNEQLMQKYPVSFIYHDVTTPEGAALLSELADEAGISTRPLPITFIGEQVFQGFESPETDSENIENAIKNYLEGKQNGEVIKEPTEFVDLPLVGRIRPMDFSLPALAVMLGLIDGFNPCAMWVLVYLISLVSRLESRKKKWLLVVTFVLASGVLYFLFMSAWLNVFLLIGYTRPIMIMIGLFAVGIGILSARDYIQTKSSLVCEVVDETSKEKTISKMESVVSSPLTLATIGGIIILAFAVNSIEFVCSSAIPAIFTEVLALRNLSTIQYYGYVLLYDVFFMLDDFIIFGLATFAISSYVGEKYAKYCKLLGGIILLILGILLLFAPHLLR